jgi:hypothetical protein
MKFHLVFLLPLCYNSFGKHTRAKDIGKLQRIIGHTFLKSMHFVEAIFFFGVAMFPTFLSRARVFVALHLVPAILLIIIACTHAPNKWLIFGSVLILILMRDIHYVLWHQKNGHIF